MRISSSQAEGAKTEFSISTTGFSGEGGKVKKLHYTRVDDKLQPVPGTEGTLDADLVLFAMGFSGPVETDIVAQLGLKVVPRGRFKGLDATEKDYKLPGDNKLFAAGDIRRGQIPRRLGHPRRPPGRGQHRQVPDGEDEPAEVIAVRRVQLAIAVLHRRSQRRCNTANAYCTLRP